MALDTEIQDLMVRIDAAQREIALVQSDVDAWKGNCPSRLTARLVHLKLLEALGVDVPSESWPKP